MTVTHVKNRCSVRGCPHPLNEDWHHCIAAGYDFHICDGSASHQHVPRRNHPGSRIVACLCITLHSAIDQGFKHNGRFLKNYVAESWMCNSEVGRVVIEEGDKCEDCDENGKRVYVIADRESGEVLGEWPL